MGASRIKIRPAFQIGDFEIEAGTRRTVSIPFGRMSNHVPMALTAQVIHGKQDGPRMFVSAAIHGDEVNGVEIIRRLLAAKSMNRLRGTLIAIPIVNVHGFISHSRYLPDRRDLNRSFPGNDKGSLASQLAHLFQTEVVSRCTHGIDLHTASFHRNNLPQVRAQLAIPEQKRIALAFGAPVVLNSAVREGSLREAAQKIKVHTLLYEAGEALRFDEGGIRTGYRGIISVMQEIGMLAGRASKRIIKPVISQSSTWVRSPGSGVLRAICAPGTSVEAGDLLGVLSDPFGEMEIAVEAHETGIIIGRTNLPVVNQGDALFHIALFGDDEKAAKSIDLHQEEVEEAVERDEPPIV